MDVQKPVAIGDGIYWVGMGKTINELHCNAYLIVDNKEAVLIDPGSVLDFPIVFQKVTSIISLSSLNYIILLHQDPDVCSTVPLFEQKGVNVEVVTHWRTSLLVKYYGLVSPFFLVNENGNELILRSGRKITFCPVPYLHFPGAIAAFDQKTKTLFSGDLFGAISPRWKLYADEQYMEIMKTFHEHYVPGNEVIRPVMEMLLSMKIDKLCPEHGSIIEERVREHIIALRDLECGLFLHPIKKKLARSEDYTGLCNQILQRYLATYGRETVKEVFLNSNIKVDPETGLLKDFFINSKDLWNSFFWSCIRKRGCDG